MYTDKLEETIRFYVEQLGFVCTGKNDDWDWASLSKDNVHIMLGRFNSHNNFTKAAFTGSLYINVNNIDELWEQLKDKTNICYAIENFDWQMREFAVYDNNGYIIQFGQPVN